MTDSKSYPWTRRRVLQALPAMLAPVAIPAKILAAADAAKLPPFSRFVDVSQSAGLTQTMFYGDPQRRHCHHDDTRGRHVGRTIQHHQGDEQQPRKNQHRVTAESVFGLENQQNCAQQHD